MPHSKDIIREFHPKARLNITYQKPCLAEGISPLPPDTF